MKFVCWKWTAQNPSIHLWIPLFTKSNFSFFLKNFYNVLLVSATEQCKSATIIHISPPYWASLPFPHPSPWGHHSGPGWAPCVRQQLLTSSPCYTWHCIYADATFSIHPTLSFSHCVYKSILYICISIPSLQIGSLIPFF